MIDRISKFVAQIYSLVPGDLKTAIFPLFWLMVTSYLTLATDWLQQVVANADKIHLPLLIFIIGVIAVIANYISKKAANRGEEILVQEGDKKTIEKLETKVADTKEVLKEKGSSK